MTAADPFEGKNRITLAEWLAVPEKVRNRLLGRRGGAARSGDKYRARKTERHGITFDSKWEADVYDQLLARQRAGEISGLETQVELALDVEGKAVAKWTLDFGWRDAATGQQCYGEAKSEGTRRARDYPLRKRMFEAHFGIEVEEFIQRGRRRAPGGKRRCGRK